MADITYIPIRQLYPHPDNPRKELGDLSELAASIKENGVYQNLTVIPGHYLNSREYIAKCVDEGGDAAAAAAAWTPKAVWSSEGLHHHHRPPPGSSSAAGRTVRTALRHRGDGRAGADADHDD